MKSPLRRPAVTGFSSRTKVNGINQNPSAVRTGKSVLVVWLVWAVWGMVAKQVGLIIPVMLSEIRASCASEDESKHPERARTTMRLQGISTKLSSPGGRRFRLVCRSVGSRWLSPVLSQNAQHFVILSGARVT